MKKIITILFAAAILSACTREMNDSQSARREIKFSAGIGNYMTKASESGFDYGDRIGLYAVQLGISDLPMTVQGDKVVPEQRIYWDPTSSEDVQFLAYYPYDVDFVPVRTNRIKVATDQSSYDSYTQSDLMTADVTANSSREYVPLVFKHLLSRMIIDVGNQTEETITSVTVNGVSMDLQHYAALYDGTQIIIDAIRAFPYTSDGIRPYRAGPARWVFILPPQEVSPRIEVVTTYKDKEHTYQFISENDIVFPQGGSVIASVTLDGSVGEVAFTHQITGWNDAGSYTLNNIYGQGVIPLYVLDESGSDNNALKLMDGLTGQVSRSLYPIGEKQFGEYNYSIYDISGYNDKPIQPFFIGNQSWVGDIITPEIGAEYWLYRSPVRTAAISSPDSPYDGLELPTVQASISEFLQYGPNAYQKYELTGYVRDLSDRTMGVFNLQDEEGAKVRIYRLRGEKGSFAYLNVDEGDNIRIEGLRSSYNNTPEMEGAVLLQNLTETKLSWSILGEMTNWEDVPMNWSRNMKCFRVVVPYASGQPFLLRADSDWVVSCGAKAGEAPEGGYPMIDGRASLTAYKQDDQRAVISIDTSVYGDYSGNIAVAYFPYTGEIIVIDADIYDFSSTPWSVMEIISAKDNTPIDSFNAQVWAVSTRGFIAADKNFNGHFVMVYQGASPTLRVSLGDYVNIAGTKTTYGGYPEITNEGLVVTSLSDSNNGSEDNYILQNLENIGYTDITDTVDSWQAGTESVPVEVSGILRSRTRMDVDGCSRYIELFYPNTSITAITDEILSNSISDVRLKGFIVQAYTGRLSVLPTAIEVGNKQ